MYHSLMPSKPLLSSQPDETTPAQLEDLRQSVVAAQQARADPAIAAADKFYLPGTLLIIKTGSTLASLSARRGDFEDWILSGLGIGREETRVVDVRQGEPLPEVGRVSAVVVTGSHNMVTERLDWSERTAEWLAGAVEYELPLLGICYGHQLLARALGGEVGDNPNGREYGTVDIQLQPAARLDPLFGGLPAVFKAHVGHVQSVVGLPPGAVRLASSARERHQSFRLGACAWGVQFHPEFDASVSRAYLGHNRSLLAQEGQDPAHLEREITATPHSAALLRRFSTFVLQKGSVGRQYVGGGLSPDPEDPR